MIDPEADRSWEERAAAMPTGTPPAWSGINPEEELMSVTFTATQTMGTSMWVSADVLVGSHLLICLFPDISDGWEHAYHGIFSIVKDEQ